MKRDRPVLAILTHWSDCLNERRYLVKLMIPRWKEMGFEVIVVNDREPHIAADFAFVHCDLSVMPESVRRLAQRYSRVINHGALDIRKRRFSSLLLRPQDTDCGEVIIKTDWNSGGGQEFRLRVLESPVGRLLKGARLRRFVLRQLTKIETNRSWGKKSVLGFSRYPVLNHIEMVPPGVWKNPNLVVERFRPERDGKHYCCRHWLFMGTKEVTRRTFSLQPIVKVGDRIEPTADRVPDELRSVRARMGIDYGKFDYGIVDGKVALYDVNHTPGANADTTCHEDTVSVLSSGLLQFWDGVDSKNSACDKVV
jgi:hypothetical protein